LVAGKKKRKTGYISIYLSPLVGSHRNIHSTHNTYYNSVSLPKTWSLGARRLFQ
jgi:hypothetical protein